MGLVDVLRLAQRPADAREVLSEAIARFEQKGNEVMTGKAQTLLDELRDG